MYMLLDYAIFLKMQVLFCVISL